jgi:hypothetical protein
VIGGFGHVPCWLVPCSLRFKAAQSSRRIDVRAMRRASAIISIWPRSATLRQGTTRSHGSHCW